MGDQLRLPATGPLLALLVALGAAKMPTTAAPATAAAVAAPRLGVRASSRDAAPDAGALRITVLFDNTVADPRLRAAWGFAALIEHRGHTVLFDTGGDAGVFGPNLDSLGIDPRHIEAIAISHAHDDHIAGLAILAAGGRRVLLYALPAFPAAFRERFGSAFRLADAAPGQELSPGVFTTGELVDPAVGVPEQSLVIPTDSGLVIVTACAHPGIVAIVRRAVAMYHAPVYLVAGGFHLLQKSDVELDAIIAEFRRLGVRRVGATHCTGERAIARLAAAYGQDFVPMGAGRVLLIGG